MFFAGSCLINSVLVALYGDQSYRERNVIEESGADEIRLRMAISILLNINHYKALYSTDWGERLVPSGPYHPFWSIAEELWFLLCDSGYISPISIQALCEIFGVRIKLRVPFIQGKLLESDTLPLNQTFNGTSSAPKKLLELLKTQK